VKFFWSVVNGQEDQLRLLARFCIKEVAWVRAQRAKILKLATRKNLKKIFIK
jgi:hypothetical protein